MHYVQPLAASQSLVEILPYSTWVKSSESMHTVVSYTFDLVWPSVLHGRPQDSPVLRPGPRAFDMKLCLYEALATLSSCQAQ